MLGGEPPAVVAAPEAKAAWDGYMKSGASHGLELKAGLSSASNSAGYVVPPETERAIERRLMAGSPMREIATVRTVGSGVFRKPVSTAGVTAGWVAETAARPETDPATLALLEFSSADLYACPAATQSLLDDALIDLDEWLAAEVEDAFAAQETAAFVSGDGVNKPKGFLGDPARVWDQPPEEPAFPHLLIGKGESRGLNADGGGVEHRLTLTCASRFSGMEEARAVAAAVRARVADAAIEADGVRAVSLGVTFTDVFRSADLKRGQSRAWAVMRLRAVTEEV